MGKLHIGGGVEEMIKIEGQVEITFLDNYTTKVFDAIIMNNGKWVQAFKNEKTYFYPLHRVYEVVKRYDKTDQTI
jgi:hypothetical protein